MRTLTAALVTMLFAVPAQAVPIALGEHRAGLSVEFFQDPDQPEPCCIELSLSPVSLDTDTRTSGAGEAGGALRVDRDLFAFEADARVPGAAGRSVVTARGLALATLTNAGSQRIDDVGLNLFGEIFAGFRDDLGEIGVAALVDEPARETALWSSVFILSAQEAGPCFDPNATDGGCALAVDPVFLEAPPSSVFAPDFTFRPAGPLLSVAPGESRSFFLTVQARAEAVRIAEPAGLSLLIAGLVVLSLLRYRGISGKIRARAAGAGSFR